MRSLRDNTKNAFNTYSESYLQDRDDLHFAGWDEDDNPFWTDENGKKYYESRDVQGDDRRGSDSGDNGKIASDYVKNNFGAPPISNGQVTNPSMVLGSWPGSQNYAFGGVPNTGGFPGATDIPQTAGSDKYSQESLRQVALENDRVQQMIMRGHPVVMERNNVVGGAPVRKSVLISPGRPGADVYRVRMEGPLNTNGTLIPDKTIQFVYPPVPGSSDDIQVVNSGGGGSGSGTGGPSGGGGDCDCGGGGTGGASGGTGGPSGGSESGGSTSATGQTPPVTNTKKVTATDKTTAKPKHDVTQKKHVTSKKAVPTNPYGDPGLKWEYPIAPIDNLRVQQPFVPRPPKPRIDNNKTDTGIPKWMTIGEKEVGVAEYDKGNNPRITEYFEKTTYHATQSEPWCSAYMNWVMTSSGIKGTGSAKASSWSTWGQELQEPVYGGVAVLVRKDGTGHVGIIAGQNSKGKLMLLGGNQSDKVSVAPLSVKKGDKVYYRYPTGYKPTNKKLPTIDNQEKAMEYMNTR